MSADSMTDELPIGAGAAAGIAAWVLTYLITYLVTASDFRNSLFGQFTDVPVWKSVGWVFFNAHFVETVFEIPIFGGSGSFIGGDDGFTVLLYIVPVLLLLGAGLIVGRYGGAPRLNAGRAALAGATLTVGYLVLSIIGVVLFPTENVTPDAVTAVLLAGIVYPLLFGGVGGFIAHIVGDDGSL